PSQVNREQALPVGSFSPNAIGLYDVHGNVSEWVEDCWFDDYSTKTPNDGAPSTEGNCEGHVGSRGPELQRRPRAGIVRRRCGRKHHHGAIAHALAVRGRAQFEFHLQGPRAVDVKQVGCELGVRYVLEGSVRKAAKRVRITGHLVDVTTGM